MINTNKLRAKIFEAGYTYRTLAPTVGMGVTSLGKKINGQSAFTVPEVMRMCEALHINSNEDKVNIFLGGESQHWDSK